MKEVKPGQEEVKIYYTKGVFFPFGEDMEKARKNPDMSKYELVCHHPIWRAPGYTDYQILEAIFELFNWVHDGFQPHHKEIGFFRPETVHHTSMSVGDIVEINGVKYLCDMVGWVKVGA